MYSTPSAPPGISESLPPGVKSISPFACLDSVDILIDVRPYNDFARAHIDGAINVCIPSTLLKRDSLSLNGILTLACVEPDTRSAIANAMKNRSNKLRVVLYDQCLRSKSYSYQLIMTLAKFSRHHDVFDVFYLDGGFQDRAKGNDTAIVNHSLSPAKEEFSNKSSAGLGGFELPSASPSHHSFFQAMKKSHSDSSPPPPLEMHFSYPLDYSPATIASLKLLPSWLLFLANTSGRALVRHFASKFNKIEHLEQTILYTLATTTAANSEAGETPPAPTSTSGAPAPTSTSTAPTPAATSLAPQSNSSPAEFSDKLSRELDSPLCPLASDIKFCIPQGIENGFKNRYKNVWPYEHLRVKLESRESGDDYFNGNHIDCGVPTRASYIATQNPLAATVSDFWQIIESEGVNFIISLDNSRLDYLQPSAHVRHVEMVLSNKDTAVRRVNHKLFHLEFKTWPDFGVPISFDSIIALIAVKNRLSRSMDSVKVLVHCLAGCGRTGVFITLDALFGFYNLDTKMFLSLTDDLIYKLVKHQRTQRILMVQTLEQFIACYEIVLYYLAKVEAHGNQDYLDLTQVFEQHCKDALL